MKGLKSEVKGGELEQQASQSIMVTLDLNVLTDSPRIPYRYNGINIQSQTAKDQRQQPGNMYLQLMRDIKNIKRVKTLKFTKPFGPFIIKKNYIH